MALRRVDGTALLVAGQLAPGEALLDASAVHTLGQIGEALLATGAAWQIRRLAASGGERNAADRATVKRHVDELVAESARVAIVVVIGTIVTTKAGPALVTGAQPLDYPDDATLPLSWIRERLLAAKAEQVVVVVSASGDTVPRAWLDALATERATHLIAVERCEGAAHAAVDGLLTGLCGDALDPRTGTVTMASLGDHLAHVPLIELQFSTASETVAQPPPLAGLWDVRRSQLSQRPPRARAKHDPEDLAGVVLPGRFRVDKLVARGTFGTVYRARQLAVERDVAVKVLHADIDPSSEDGRLFVHEIRSVGRIDHTNVVRIHQADITHDGRLFFAMEHLDGQDLQTLGAAGPLPRERVVDLGRQLLAGLAAAHDAGLVHADVKPANAIVVPDSRGKPGAAIAGESGPLPVLGGERVVLVDFGLSRLRAPDRPTASAGGTPAYMAPEQLHEGRVDARSDLFSAALVLVYLLTGWRRPNAFTLVPPADIIPDADLRAVIGRALATDPAQRYQSARELAAALIGIAAPTPVTSQPMPILPFRHLAALTERDRDRLYGREADLAVLAEHALFRRSVIYTAPSGTGKTSMLCAGLLPRLEALGLRAVYLRCRADSAAMLAAAIDQAPRPLPRPPAVDPVPPTPRPGMASEKMFSHLDNLATQPRAVADHLATARTGDPTRSSAVIDAITAWHEQGGGKLVLVLDQLEAALGDRELLRAVLAFDRLPAGADVAVVLSVREDYLARLVAQTQELEPNIPIVRLPPLSLAGARAAITGPLTEARLAIEPELLDTLLDDLVRAASAIGPEMGWGGARAVYPPHLQLACSILYEALGPGDATITLASYRALGGFDAIVGEHLDRVLDTELADGRDVIARDLFVALVTTANERAVRSESELLAMVGAHHDPADITAVLEVLRSRGLLVRVRAAAAAADGDASWELVHDSLVPRVLAWLDRRDLARRRAIELVRYHLRRSRPELPALLGRPELRELRSHAGAIAELDAEWQKRGSADAWTPARLVARSHQVLRRRTLTLISALVAAGAIASIGMYRSHLDKEHARAEARLKSLDLGRCVLSLEPFDWDPVAQRATPVAAASVPLAWELHAPDPDDPSQPGPLLEPVVRGTLRLEATAAIEAVEARGGRAFLVVDRAGCNPSIVPLRQLPGYAARDREVPTLHVAIPSCQATRADTVAITAGAFIFGGLGEPVAKVLQEYPDYAKERRLELPAFRIDRTEVTNASFATLSQMASITGIAHPRYPGKLELAANLRIPVTGIDWSEARAFCRFLGKQLPSSQQWVRALRGGERLADGTPNPAPRRNLPWGVSTPEKAANVGADWAAQVGTFPTDRSPDGVVDLAGNVQEWTATESPDHDVGFRVARGGNWSDTELSSLVDFMALENYRPIVLRNFAIGVRCVDL